MTWILTHTSKHFDFADPQPDQIDITDIAQGLAHECRYAGQCRMFYSVAQHSVLASEIVGPEHALEALLHDAAEAYCKDIPRPLKRMLPDYQAIEARVGAAIRARFGLPTAMSEQVKCADLTLLATERRNLMPHDTLPWPVLENVAPLTRAINALQAREAHALFLARWQELALLHPVMSLAC